MAIHDEVLRAAQRQCRRRGWRFRPIEIVNALPHLDPGSVRTHITSRCCVNAPANHPHRWPYFKRVDRGLYEVLSKYRGLPRKPSSSPVVAERAPRYSLPSGASPRDTVHVVAFRSGDRYVAECLEIAVVTQARTFDELIDNLREAVDLHLEGEDTTALGLVPAPRLAITYDLAPPSSK